MRWRDASVLGEFRLPGPRCSRWGRWRSASLTSARRRRLSMSCCRGAERLGFPTFATLYSFASMLGIASHAPGGLGVFEATILQGVGGNEDAVLASLLLFRGIYYAVPFIAAMAMLGGVEAVRRWRSLREAMSARVGRLAGTGDEPSPRRKSSPTSCGSPFASQLIGAMPEPAVIVGSDERAAAANQPALGPAAWAQGRRSVRARPARPRRDRRAPPGDGERRSRDGAVERTGAGRTAVRRQRRAARDRRRRRSWRR